jgi:Uma2 family endonuclease
MPHGIVHNLTAVEENANHAREAFMATTTQVVSAEDLMRLPDDGFRYELVKGELVKMPPAGSAHGNSAMKLGWRLAHHVETNRLGVVFAAETGFRISSDPDTVRGIDIAFVSQRRIEEVGDVQGYWPGAPDLAVEVISPGDTYTEVEEKVEAYLQAGSKAVWVVNPQRRTVAVYRSLSDVAILLERDMLDAGEVVPGFQCRVSEIFSA